MKPSSIRTIVAAGLAIGTIIFVGLLGGVGSGALTETPTAADVNAYESTRTTTTSNADAGAGESQLTITGVDFETGTVAITNVGSAAGSLDGLWLCNFPTYTPISGSVEPGATADVAFGTSAGSGEVGLYTSQSFGNAESIIAYVEWGSSGHRRSGVAVEAGVWDGGTVAGEVTRLVAIADFPTAASDWSTQ